MFYVNDKVIFVKGSLKGKVGTIIDIITGWNFIERQFVEEIGLVIKLDNNFIIQEKVLDSIIVEKYQYDLIDKIYE